MNTTEQVKKIAAIHMQGILSFTKDHNAPFKSLITVNVDGENKTMLLVGKAQGAGQRANCLAILNPDHDLVEKATFRLIESESLLDETFPQHCDSARYVWTDRLNKEGVSPNGIQYRARKPKPVSYIIQ